jgi:hypothetical protein
MKATPNPSVHHFFPNRPLIDPSGLRMSTSGAAVAPRWRIRKPMSVASADSAATPSPSRITCAYLPLVRSPQLARSETRPASAE